MRHSDNLTLTCLNRRLFNRCKQRLIGIGVPKSLARRIEHGYTTGIQIKAHGTSDSIEFFANEFAYLPTFIFRGAHQGDVWIMLIKQTS